MNCPQHASVLSVESARGHIDTLGLDLQPETSSCTRPCFGRLEERRPDTLPAGFWRDSNVPEHSEIRPTFQNLQVGRVVRYCGHSYGLASNAGCKESPIGEIETLRPLFWTLTRDRIVVLDVGGVLQGSFCKLEPLIAVSGNVQNAFDFECDGNAGVLDKINRLFENLDPHALYARSLARNEAFVNYSCARHLPIHWIRNG